jgi:hypothetical protein
MVIKLNASSLLIVLGGLGVFAPDAAFIATWLSSWNIHWLSHVSRAFGLLAAVFAAAPLAVPKLRAFLALLKLATPAGTVVPLPEPKPKPADPNATPPPEPKATATTPQPVVKDAGFAFFRQLIILVALALMMILALLIPLLIPRLVRADEAAAPTLPPLPTLPASISPSSTPPLPTSPEVAPVASVAPAIYDSRYGGCKGNFCLAPALAIQAFQYVPSTGDMAGGVVFAGGYGILWHTMIDLGLAFYGGVQFSRDKPFTAQGLAMFNIANYVAFGPGFEMLGQPSGPARFRLTVCFAANWIPGLITPSEKGL